MTDLEPGITLSRTALVDDLGVETVIQLTVIPPDGSDPVTVNMSPDMALEVAAQLLFLAAETDPHLIDGAT